MPEDPDFIDEVVAFAASAFVGGLIGAWTLLTLLG